ncbi:hypothetical protein MK974_25735 [Burkholderia ambifaria]|uniref:hypothetical protein n=1 Tax=Burkholderia ambifaria TaxID=152480 RepID=UPI0022A998DE|nr:hypothetical protein [Burkholderia ambifaria]WAS56494.1 hypothetical protein MK974_25735 [Burkholderia ambifaria]
MRGLLPRRTSVVCRFPDSLLWRSVRPLSLQHVETRLSGQNKQAASHRPPCRMRQGLASKRRARSGSRAGFLIHLRISFAAICEARTRDAYTSGAESSALHARVALRDAAHERNRSRIAVAWTVAGKRARRPPRCAAHGRDTMRPRHSGRALQIRNISNLSARTTPALHHGGEITHARPESDAR